MNRTEKGAFRVWEGSGTASLPCGSVGRSLQQRSLAHNPTPTRSPWPLISAYAEGPFRCHSSRRQWQTVCFPEKGQTPRLVFSLRWGGVACVLWQQLFVRSETRTSSPGRFSKALLVATALVFMVQCGSSHIHQPCSAPR